MIKRILSGAAALTMAASVFALSADAAILGDVDDSGNVDIEDAVTVLNHINGVKSLSDLSMNAADVNTSGSVDIEDVVAIINQINGVQIIVNNSATLEGLEKHLRDNGIISAAARKLDPAYYQSSSAVEFTGECTIVMYNKTTDAEAIEKLSRMELTAPDGSNISFQGFCQTDNVVFAFSYDYSDYSGSHGVEWQKSLGDNIFAYCYK